MPDAAPKPNPDAYCRCKKEPCPCICHKPGDNGLKKKLTNKPHDVVAVKAD